MADVVVSRVAAESLQHLIVTHSLPQDAGERVRRSIAPLREFPRLGRALQGGGYEGARFVVGPWRWMVIVYDYDVDADAVNVLLIEDARSSQAATRYRP